MPYKTGVLVHRETISMGPANVTDEVSYSDIISIMNEFFGEEISLRNSSSNGIHIIFETPLNIPIVLRCTDAAKWYFHLTSAGSNSYWSTGDDSYGSSEDASLSLNYHVAINKNNTIMSLGVGFPSIGEPFFTVTIIKTGDSYIAIQHGVTDKRDNADKTWAKDAYHKSETDCKMTSAKASGGYYSDSKLVLVPAIDPWTGNVIPDLYLSLLRPIDTRSVRNLISINGRQFISGVVNDDGGDAYIQAMPIFIEI